MKVDGIDIEGGIASRADGLGDDLSSKGEQQSWALDHNQRLDLVRGNVFDPEDAGIVEFELEQCVRAGSSAALQHEADLVIRGPNRTRVHVDLQRNLRTCLLSRQGTGRVRVFERKIFSVLSQYRKSRNGGIIF